MFDISILYNDCYKYAYDNEHTVQVHQGGTSSGKTYSIIQCLFVIAAENPKSVITVAGQDIPNLKAGALRDALTIYNNSEELKTLIKSYNKSDRIFEYLNGSIIEFKSYDDSQDAKSGKRDYLFVNEANGISFEVYNELALRTKEKIFIDYNPNSAFWVHDNLLGRQGVQLIISDHRHNRFLPQVMRDKIESLRQIDEELWKVYARGLTGKITGLVLNNWVVVDRIPVDAKPIANGLDFGFTNDDTGLIEVYLQNGELWVNELIYETGLTNSDISDKMIRLGVTKNRLIIADSAEPKSIEELSRLGWNIEASLKGPDSIKNGLDILRRYRINVTRSSVNLRNELGRYKWRTDKDGRSLNEPIDAYNHLIDPLRYVALNKLKIATVGKARTRLPYVGNNRQPSEYDFVK